MSGVLRAMPCCHPQCLNTPESAHTSKTCSTACLPSSQYHKLCGSWPTALDPYPPAHTDNIYTQIIMNTLTTAPQISNLCIPELQNYIDLICIMIMYNVYRTFHNHCLDSQSSSDITALDPYPPAHTDNIYTQIIMNTLTTAPQISNLCIPELQNYIDLICIMIMYNVYRTFHNHCLDSQSSSDIITDHYLRWILVPSIGLSKML